MSWTMDTAEGRAEYRIHMVALAQLEAECPMAIRYEYRELQCRALEAWIQKLAAEGKS